MLDDDVKEEERQAYVELLRNMQRLSPVPGILREYGRLSSPIEWGSSGENFASLVKSILASKEKGAAYVSWLRDLLLLRLKISKFFPVRLGSPSSP